MAIVFQCDQCGGVVGLTALKISYQINYNLNGHSSDSFSRTFCGHTCASEFSLDITNGIRDEMGEVIEEEEKVGDS